jgi:hypothetical protein
VLTLVSTVLNKRHNYAFDWFLESIDDSGIIGHKDGPLGTGRQSNPGTWFMCPDDQSLRMPQQWTIFTLELHDIVEMSSSTRADTHDVPQWPFYINWRA